MALNKKDTPEAREFWALAEKTAAEVAEWPEWKKASFRRSDPQPRTRFQVLMKNAKSKE
jgi:hypothetical protein